ncbi:nitroreductase family protein [bacterium]|nr:nitroreductase family protein [bacterium]MBR0192554.1 nitroreductase family protein [Thermoguttaceae bacterium]
MIQVDLEKCCRCGACVKDCVVNVLQLPEEGVPFALPEREAGCMHCGHCLAVCPTGALTCDGKSAADCEPLGVIPKPEEMIQLIRQRRSIRQWKEQPIDDEILEKLKSSLDWAPTGCNVHNLQFIIVDSPARMEWLKARIYSRLRNRLVNFICKLFRPKFARFMDYILSGDDVIFFGAPAMIVALVPKNAPCADFDPVIALTQFGLCAQTFGLGTCWCGFAQGILEKVPGMKKLLAVPAGYRVGAVMLFGWPDVKYHRCTKPEPFEKRS